MRAGEFFHSAQSRDLEQQREHELCHLSGESIETPLLQDQELSVDSSKQVKLGFLAGLVPREKSMVFDRILFCATRGNVFLRQATVEDPVTDPVSREKMFTCRLRKKFLWSSMLVKKKKPRFLDVSCNHRA